MKVQANDELSKPKLELADFNYFLIINSTAKTCITEQSVSKSTGREG